MKAVSANEPRNGNAAVPTTFQRTHQRPPPLASWSHSMKETTSSRAVAPSAPPQGPLQKPPIIPKDGAPTREIGVLFSNSGRRPPSSISLAPPVGCCSPSPLK